LKDNAALSEEDYKILRSSTSSTPLFYALIKIHKENYPIRPIVSFIDSPTYNLSRHLSKILTSVTNHGTSSKLKSTSEIKSLLQDVVIPANYSLVSFDVKSLFTCIPQDFALNSCKTALESFTDLSEITRLNTSEIISLTKMCLDASTFQWHSEFYRQIRGCPMGSPISVAISELSIQNFEKSALSNAPCRPLFWKRYVDDILTALPSNLIQEFLDHLNSQNENIQFTHEIEANNVIPFLDLNIHRKDDGAINFSVFRKGTHTNRYLDSASYHPLSQKVSTAKSLFYRAHVNCSPEHIDSEIENITEALTLNGYSKKLINRELKSTTDKFLNRQTPNNSVNPVDVRKRYASAPYIRGASERTAKILKPFGIQLAHKSIHSLRSQLVKVKDHRQLEEKTSVIYRINCKDCSHHYIGETSREFGKRLKEHQNSVRRRDPQSALYTHIEETGHNIDWESPTILTQQQGFYQRKMMESIFSLNDSEALNRSLTLPVPFVPLVTAVRNSLRTQ